MKKRLNIIMTMFLLAAMLVIIMPAQVTEAKGKVKLSTTKKVLQVGKTYTVTLKNAKNVKWKSSRKSVAVITKKGTNRAKIIAKAPGKSTVTASYKGKKYKCRITVSEKNTQSDNPVLNATDVMLYCVSDDYQSFVQENPNHLKEFQFKVSGTKQKVKSWTLLGEDKDYFDITSYGKVTVNWVVPYNTIAHVTVRATLKNGTTLEATVSLQSEINEVINQKFQGFKDTYITSSMSQAEIVEKIAWYVGAFSDYEAGNNSWMDLLLKGRGDCWASRMLVVYMCDYVGIKAVACDVNHHGQTIVKADGKYYMVVTGYKEPRPRSYMVYEIETDDIKEFCNERGVQWEMLE